MKTWITTENPIIAFTETYVILYRGSKVLYEDVRVSGAVILTYPKKLQRCIWDVPSSNYDVGY